MTDREKMIELTGDWMADCFPWEKMELSTNEMREIIGIFADRLIAAGFAGVEKIGETTNVPGSNGGFTMAVFKGWEVPLGTDVFRRRP